MIRPVDFLDHPLAGDPVEHRQEQGILPDKRLHGPDRTLHSHKFDGKDDEICRHCFRRGAVCKSAFLPVAAHARLAVSFHTRFVRDKKYMPISELLCQMISVHDAERGYSPRQTASQSGSHSPFLKTSFPRRRGCFHRNCGWMTCRRRKNFLLRCPDGYFSVMRSPAA